MVEFQKVPLGVTVFQQPGHLMQRITLKIRDTQQIDRLQFSALLLMQAERQPFILEIDFNRLPCRSYRALDSDAGKQLHGLLLNRRVCLIQRA